MLNNPQTMLQASVYFLKSGLESVLEDEVTQRFSSSELKVWNLLSRNHNYEHINITLTLLWIFGFFIRYFILLPIRLLIASTSIILLAIMCYGISLIPKSKLKRYLYVHTVKFCFCLFVRAFSAVITFHNIENRAGKHGICVANHTTPVDIVTLGCDNAYALVGQKHGGFIGFIERVLSNCESHIWFERNETRDRLLVMKKMRDHVEDPEKLPILVFPEGTCINNTSVMMFKKGSFEIGGIIYPVSIKYDHRFADCFWNSSLYSLPCYLLMMMSSWAIKADVWYLPPEKQQPNETSIEFADRVKALIARRGGMRDLRWDGGLKRSKPSASLKSVQQESLLHLLQQKELDAH